MLSSNTGSVLAAPTNPHDSDNGAADPSDPKLGRSENSPSLRERFSLQVDRSAGPDACHPWTGPRDQDGYGVLVHRGEAFGAHRVALALAGRLDPGREAGHAVGCAPACCNARHLSPQVHGSRRRLSRAQVLSLFRAAGGGGRVVALLHRSGGDQEVAS